MDFVLGMGAYYIISFYPILAVAVEVVKCLNANILGLRFGAALHHKNAAKQTRGLPFCVALLLTGEIFSISRYYY